MKDELEPKNIKIRYDSINSIWDEKDLWHDYTYRFIKKYISKYFLVETDSLILNAGSAGNTYDVPGKHIHLDISETKLKEINNSVVGDICNLPFNEEYFDYIICVGSVINYCDAFKALTELNRVLKNKGKLVIEFESSRSYEYFKGNDFNRSVAVVKTFYQGKEEILYVYSPKYVNDLLRVNDFRIIDKRPFHIISPLSYLISKNSNKSSQFSRFDNYLYKMSPINMLSSNIIMICQKVVL